MAVVIQRTLYYKVMMQNFRVKTKMGILLQAKRKKAGVSALFREEGYQTQLLHVDSVEQSTCCKALEDAKKSNVGL